MRYNLRQRQWTLACKTVTAVRGVLIGGAAHSCVYSCVLPTPVVTMTWEEENDRKILALVCMAIENDIRYIR